MMEKRGGGRHRYEALRDNEETITGNIMIQILIKSYHKWLFLSDINACATKIKL